MSSERGSGLCNTLRRSTALATTLLGTGLLWGCGDLYGPADPPVPVAATGTVSDPAGDTFGAGLIPWDLTSLTITQDAGGITVAIDFSSNLIAPTSGDERAMVGFVDFDVDQDSATGITPTVDEFRPNSGSTGMGADYQLALTTFEPDSTVAVTDSLGNTTGRVKPVFDPRRVTIRIPRALLGNDDGLLSAAAIVGTTGRPTDIIPEQGHLTVRRMMANTFHMKAGAEP